MAYFANAILLCVFFGLCCSYFAEKQGRSRLIWFVIGFLCPLLGAALLFFLPRPQKKRAIQKKAPHPPKPAEHVLKTWFYVDETHQSCGPIDFIILNKSWKNKEINENSYVWAEGMEDWRKIRELPEIHKELAKK